MYTIDTIDTIDNAVATIEDSNGTLFSLPVSWLPENAKEGDKLQIETVINSETSQIQFAVSLEFTEQAQKRIQIKLDRLRARNTG